MLPVFNKPTIQYVVEEAVSSGIEDILIITGKGKRSIEDHFDRSFELEYSLRKCGKMDNLIEVEGISEMADIYYVRQKQQRGLGDAILCAEKHIDGQPFAVLLGDTITQSKIPCTQKLIEIHEKYETSVIAIESVPQDKIERYGIIKGHKVDKSIYKIEDLVEKPRPEVAPSNLAITGRYLLMPEIFEHLKEITPGVGGEIQLTDAMRALNSIYGYVFPGKMYDIGNIVDWLKSSLELALKDPKVEDELIDYLKNILKI